MSRPIAVLRPEPGNRITAAAIEGRGRRAIRLPLFATRPIAWGVPDAAAFDALILTSANAVRWAGEGLAALQRLPVYAVGEATASAARRAGLEVAAVGQAGAAALATAAEAAGVRRALHLTGRERTLEAGGIVAAVVPVYASETLPVSPEAVAALSGSVALIQSARAGVRLAEIAPDRAGIALAAISAAAAAAAGEGWAAVAIAPVPETEALIEAAIALYD
ncbi:uroporphyrinogen-III synthase [Sphingomonas sp. HT-1]|uniref:uroporphyrinogen-III synthase n=1 Tax=unclassified Sphingomonas TaxID=196159 RepID=UPI00031CBD4B|nr:MULTISPECIES: uroporphyrinogen-III synthase [unclassified Sphingomonas]KTF69625.1 uroporphyrinogen-III synthase [Sphingomonas sp. WG]